MSGTRTLLFVVLCAHTACVESVAVPRDATRDAGAPSDAAPSATPTIARVSDEIDLSAVDDRAIGFRETASGLVAESTHAARVTAYGVTLGIDGTPVALGHARVDVGGEAIALGAPGIDADAHATRDGANVHEVIESRATAIAQSWRFARRPSGAIEVRVPIHGATLDHVDAAGLHLVLGGARFVYSHARFIDARGAASDVEARFEDGEVVLRVDATLVSLTEFPAVLDPTIGPEVTITGPPVVPDTAFGDDVRVVMAGTRAIVVWLVDNQREVRCSYLDPGETVATRPARVLYASPGAFDDLEHSHVAVSGSTAMLIAGQGSRVVYMRFTTSCVPIDASLRVLENPGNFPQPKALVPYAGGFIAAWRSSTTRIRAIAIDGTPLWTNAVSITDATQQPMYVQLLVEGSDLLVLYRNLGYVGLRAQRFTTSGVLVSGAPIELDSGTTVYGDGWLSAVRVGDAVFASWQGGSAQRTLARFDASTLTQTASVALDADFDRALVGFDGTNVIATANGYPDRVLFRRYTPSDLASIGAQVQAATPLTGPDVDAFDARDGFAVVAHGTSTRTYLLRLPAGAASPDAETDVGLLVPMELAPSVGSNGSGYLVAWGRTWPGTARPRAVYVSSAGTVIGAPEGFVVHDTTIDARYRGDVTGTASQYLVTYLSIAGSNELATQGRLVSPYDTTTTQAHSAYYATDARTTVHEGVLRTALVPSTSQPMWALATWPSQQTGSYASTNVAGRPMAAAGDVAAFGGTSILLARNGTTSTLATPAAELSMTKLAVGYLLAWCTNGGAVFSRRLDAVGAPVGETASLRAAGGTVSGLSTTWNGNVALVAYVANGALVAHRLDGNATPIDTTPGVLVSGVSASTPTDMAADGDGRVMIVYGRSVTVHGIASVRVFGRIVDLAAPGTDPSGAACTNGWSCETGLCVDGVCCPTACGGACDACSVAAGGSQDGVCTPRATSIVCRAVAGPCDTAETCDGTNAACPPDVFATGITCAGSSGSTCDAPDICDGTTAACPARYAPAGTSCRAGSDLCDAAETCTGLSATCPTDAVLPSGSFECRPSAGDCDVSEWCNGVSKACPTNAFRSSSTTCRASATECDRLERCTGNSASCPADAPALFGTVCRGASDLCDATETCDGIGFACPADAASNAGVVCRLRSGACDVEELCDGTSKACPVDAVADATVVCRGIGALCDAPETCNGVWKSCPPDGVRPRGYVCRAALGGCDAPETCNGSNAACPTDAVRPNGYICRAASGPCDIAESCTGNDTACLSDVHNVDGTSCDDGLVCNGSSTCEAGACVTGEPIACEEDEVCSESTRSCVPPPTDEGSGGCATGASPSEGDTATLAFFVLALAVVRRRRR